MTELTIEDVQRVLASAARAAAGYPDQAFATCVVDPGGHVLGSLRHQRAAVSAGHSAETKARTAVYLLADTGGLPADSAYVPAMTSGLPYPVNVFPGGVLIRRDGVVVGAIGVGGSRDPSQDLAVARAALADL